MQKCKILLKKNLFWAIWSANELTAFIMLSEQINLSKKFSKYYIPYKISRAILIFYQNSGQSQRIH